MHLGTDDIKAMSRGFSGGGGSDKICNFCLKDDNYSKLWVEVIIVTLLDAVATADVLKADNNDVELVETRSVHFARLNRRLVLTD